MAEPQGNLVTPIAFDPSGNPVALEVDADGALKVSGAGGVSDHGLLTGLTDDDHPQYILHSLSLAISDFLISSAAGVFVAKTLAQTKTILGIPYVHPNHSGDVTSVADGAQTIAIEAVTYAKMQHVSATDKLLGRSTAGAGDPEEIACTAAGRALLDDANAAAQLTTLGLAAATALSDFLVATGAGAFVAKTLAQTKTILGIPYVHPNHSGDVTSVSDGAQTIAVEAVTYAKMQHVSATDKLLGRSTAGAGDPEEIACTAAGRALLDDANAAAQLVTLGAVAITNPMLTARARGLASNPQALYTQRAQIVIFRTDAAITITRIHIHGSDLTPTTELAGDLKFADDINIGGFANATVIDICDTTNGVVTITAGFDDATVPANKYVYFQMDASPHADWKDFYIEVYYTYD